MDVPTIPVFIDVCINENGNADCCIRDDYNIQQQQKHQQWLHNIRQDKVLYHLHTVLVNLPMPVTFEDRT